MQGENFFTSDGGTWGRFCDLNEKVKRCKSEGKSKFVGGNFEFGLCLVGAQYLASVVCR